jgi:hypothetical protein
VLDVAPNQFIHCSLVGCASGRRSAKNPRPFGEAGATIFWYQYRVLLQSRVVVGLTIRNNPFAPGWVRIDTVSSMRRI